MHSRALNAFFFISAMALMLNGCLTEEDLKIRELEKQVRKNSENRQCLFELCFLYAYKDYEATLKAEKLIRPILKTDPENDLAFHLLVGTIYLQKARHEENMIKKLMWVRIASSYFDRANLSGKDDLVVKTFLCHLNAISPPEVSRYRFVSTNRENAEALLKRQTQVSPIDRNRLVSFYDYCGKLGSAAEDCMQDAPQEHFKNQYSFADQSFFEDASEERNFFLNLLTLKLGRSDNENT